MDVDEKELSNMWIGSAVLHALAMVATGGLFIAGVFLCRRRSDSARNVVRWLKIALFFFGIFTFLFTLSAAFYVVYLREFIFGPGTISIVSTLAYTFQIIAKTLVFTTLSSLARGILHAREGKKPKLGLPVALVTYALTVINAILAVAYLGVQMYLTFGYTGFSFTSLRLHANRLMSVPMIFLFVGSVIALGNSALVLIKVKNKFPTLKTAAIYNIAASFLFFVSSIFEIIYNGLYVPLSLSIDTRFPPESTPILLFFFSTATAFLPLALIFNLTRTKDKGLWTITASGPPGGAFAPAPVPQPGFQGQPPMQQPGFQPGFAQAPQGWAPQQPGVYYPPQQQQQFAAGTVPIQQPVPQQGYAQYPVAQAPSPVGAPSPPQGQPHVTTT